MENIENQLKYYIKENTKLKEVIDFYRYDKNTGLLGKKDADIQADISHKNFFFKGFKFSISIIVMYELNTINKNHGYEAGNRYMRKTISDIIKKTNTLTEKNIFKFGSNKLLLITPYMEKNELSDILKSISFVYFSVVEMTENFKDVKDLFNELNMLLEVKENSKYVYNK